MSCGMVRRPMAKEVAISFKTMVSAPGNQTLVNLATLSGNSFTIQDQALVI